MNVAAAGESGTSALTDPSFWINLGAVGLFVWWFFTGKLHSNDELKRIEDHSTRTSTDLIRQHERVIEDLVRHHQDTVATLKESHAQAMERMDDQIRQLMLERDKANAERNEAVGVMRDFTMMAGAVLNQQQPRQSRQQSPRRGGAQ